MEGTPCTTPDVDPCSTPQIRRRRSSLLDNWIRDQQLDPAGATTLGTRPNPWLAYPDIARLRIPDDLDDYDLVEDQDIPQIITTQPSDSKLNTPRASAASKFIHSPSLRSFSLSMRSPTPSISGSISPSPKKSLFSKGSRLESLSTRNGSTRHSSLCIPSTKERGDSFRFSSPQSRPSVLGHFPVSSQLAVQDSEIISRPSLSSGRTDTSAASTSNPSELSLISSMRRRRQSNGAASGLSIYSQSYTNTDETSTTSYTSYSKYNTRVPLKDIPIPPSNNCGPTPASGESVIPLLRKTASRIHLPSISPRNRKKKLVISGIHPDDEHRLDAACRWCQSFGEVRSIVRQRNGDLHISFRSAEVADTVCRLRKQVYITNIGSVQLSWFVGSNR